jgi:hypothetical protein
MRHSLTAAHQFSTRQVHIHHDPSFCADFQAPAKTFLSFQISGRLGPRPRNFDSTHGFSQLSQLLPKSNGSSKNSAENQERVYIPSPITGFGPPPAALIMIDPWIRDKGLRFTLQVRVCTPIQQIFDGEVVLSRVKDTRYQDPACFYDIRERGNRVSDQ